MNPPLKIHRGAVITGWIRRDIHPTAYTEDINVLRFWHQEGAEVIPLVPLAALIAARDGTDARFADGQQAPPMPSLCCEEGPQCESNLCRPDPAHPPVTPPTEVPA